MVNLLTLVSLASLYLSSVLAQATLGECGPGKLCPKDKPCCSRKYFPTFPPITRNKFSLTSLSIEYGGCGVGAYCLGGCDPIHSFSLQSCTAAPACKSQDYQLTSLDGITPNTQYLGDASSSKWVSSGTPKVFENQVLLTLSEEGASSSGTLLASTNYVWYGNVKATLKSSRGKGVVTAFILLSDVKDEIDFEFVGADLKTAQSNFYYQGITDCKSWRFGGPSNFTLMAIDNNGVNLAISDGTTFDTYHTYEIDWKPDRTTWSINGKVMRTIEKSKTYNDTTKSYHYPQTPSRVQLSLWPAGSSKNGKGTIEWSGGLVDWSSTDVKANGYYYSLFKDVSVTCYGTPPGANVTGSKAYVYNNIAGTGDSVAVTDDNTVLKSLLGSGTDMNKDYPQAAPSKASSSVSASNIPTASLALATPTDVATVPGLTGAGPGTNGQRGDTGSSGSATNSGSDSGSGSSSGSGSGSGSGTGGGTGGGTGRGSVSSSGTSSATGSTSTGSVGGFSQGQGGTTGGSSSGAPPKGERFVQGSWFAVLVAFMGMLVM